MALTPEELLKPRYKVIADYPNSPYEVGGIYRYKRNGVRTIFYEREGKFSSANLYSPEKYPHLFKPLQWWEERAESDMPEYLKIGKRIYKVIGYKNYELSGLYVNTSPLGDYDDPIKDCLPATETEYNTLKINNNE